MTRFKRLNEWILLAVIAILATLWLQAPRLLDPFQVDQDFRTFYWMNKFQDSALFSNVSDYIPVNFLGVELPFMTLSPGYGFLFYLATFFVTPVFFSKILVFIILPITVLYLFEFGRMAHSRDIGISLAVVFMLLNLASPSSSSIIPGLQRSFAGSLIIVLIYYLHTQRYVGAAITIFVSVLIYPPMFAFGGVIWALYITKIAFKPYPKLSIHYQDARELVVAALLGCLVMVPLMLPRISVLIAREEVEALNNQTTETTSETVETDSESYKYMWDNPIYRPGGQEPLFFLFPFVGRGGLVNNGEDGVHIIILLCLSGLILLVQGRRAFELPYVIWCVLWASLILFVLAWVAIWLSGTSLLYLPSRYTRVGLFLFFLVFVIWNSGAAAKEAMVAIRRDPQKLQWLIGGVAVLVMGLGFFYPSELSMIGGFNMKWLLMPVGFIFIVLAMVVIKRPTPAISNMSKLNHLPGGRFLTGGVIVVCLAGWMVYAPIVSDVDFLDPPPEERELLQFLETLPKDVLLAGTPVALDNVPLFAKRQVLFNYDLAGADSNTIRDALTAYYTDDSKVILDFCQLYGVDYLVIDSEVYSAEYLITERIFFEPYHEELFPHIITQDTFALTQIPDGSKVFTSGPYSVIECDAETLQVGN